MDKKGDGNAITDLKSLNLICKIKLSCLLEVVFDLNSKHTNKEMETHLRCDIAKTELTYADDVFLVSAPDNIKHSQY